MSSGNRKTFDYYFNMLQLDSTTIVAKILEDLLNELPIENQENEEDLDEASENQPSDDWDEDLSGYDDDIVCCVIC